MNRREGDLVYQRLRVPQQHGRALIEPQLSVLLEWIEQNANARPPRFDVLDQSAEQLRREARTHLLERLREPSPQTPTSLERSAANVDSPVIMSGHQPELFHPGVWFKNLALARLGQRSGARAINLNVDNDLCRLPAIRCPRRTANGLSMESIAYDATAEDAPFEDRRILDPELFRSFPDRIKLVLGDLVPQPIIERLWPLAMKASQLSDHLGVVLSSARADLERTLGVGNDETSVSQISNSDPFRRFALHLLAHAGEFASIHNKALAAYRRVNRVRSKAHPAPSLELSSEWIESPFWIWTNKDTQRQRSFVRRVSAGIRFGAPGRLELVLPDPEREPRAAIEALAAAEERGVRIRPRALTTTMYARLFLCDVFVHGVGGAKYDQLTDEIVRRYWRVQPLSFATLTATAQLPLPKQEADPRAVEALKAKRRDLAFHAEKFLPNPPRPAADLLKEKRELIARQPAKGEGKPRQRRLLEINRGLAELLEADALACDRARAELIAQVRQNRLLSSREFSFCLHSSPTLPQLLLDLCDEQP